MAFHPIVDMARGEVFAHEALVRGTDDRGKIISTIFKDKIREMI